MSDDQRFALAIAIVLAAIIIDRTLIRPIRQIHEDLQVIIEYLRNHQ